MTPPFCTTTVRQWNAMTPSAKAATDLTRALAGVLGAVAAGRLPAPGPMLGLSPASFAALRARHFPGQEELPMEGCVPIAADEFDDLVALLVAHRSHGGPEIEWLAHAIACACMGGNHLYQDMGLPDRHALSDLLREHFTALFGKNTGNMKWKKFFYKQLCDQAGVRACRAPSCQVCSDYWNCFGPEEPALLPLNLPSQE